MNDWLASALIVLIPVIALISFMALLFVTDDIDVFSPLPARNGAECYEHLVENNRLFGPDEKSVTYLCEVQYP